MILGDLNKAIPVWTPTRAKEVLREFIKQLDEKEVFVVEKEGMVYNAVLFALRYKMEDDE